MASEEERDEVAVAEKLPATGGCTAWSGFEFLELAFDLGGYWLWEWSRRKKMIYWVFSAFFWTLYWFSASCA